MFNLFKRFEKGSLNVEKGPFGFLADLSIDGIAGWADGESGFALEPQTQYVEINESFLTMPHKGMTYSERTQWMKEVVVKEKIGSPFPLQWVQVPHFKVDEIEVCVVCPTIESYRKLPDVSRFIEPWFLASESFIDLLNLQERINFQVKQIEIKIRNDANFIPPKKYFCVYFLDRVLFSEPDKIRVSNLMRHVYPPNLVEKPGIHFQMHFQAKLILAAAFYDTEIFNALKDTPFIGAGLFESGFFFR